MANILSNLFSNFEGVSVIRFHALEHSEYLFFFWGGGGEGAYGKSSTYLGRVEWVVLIYRIPSFQL